MMFLTERSEKYNLKSLFDASELDYEEECIIRRDILPSGKSRAFINDTPVQLTVLREIGTHLLDIHSQHQNLLINKAAFVLNFVDTIAGSEELLAKYRKSFFAYQSAKKELDEFVSLSDKAKEEEEYIRFQLSQLTDARIQEDEQEILEEEANLLTHAEEIKSGLFSISEMFDSDSTGIIQNLKKQLHIAHSIEKVYPQGILGAILLVYLAVLYDLQVNQHEDYLAKSIHSIADEEPIEASRGIITDRKGRVLVSNRSVYNLVFDTSLLGKEDDVNQSILRLLELCEARDHTWSDTLPISEQSPYTYTLDALSNSQKRNFLTYLRSLEESRQLLRDYILQHPELAQTPESEDAENTEEDEDSSDETLSTTEQADELLDQLPASAITADMLTDAGLSAYQVLMLLRDTMGS